MIARHMSPGRRGGGVTTLPPIARARRLAVMLAAGIWFAVVQHAGAAGRDMRPATAADSQDRGRIAIKPRPDAQRRRAVPAAPGSFAPSSGGNLTPFAGQSDRTATG
jgi:hypothetical protein